MHSSTTALRGPSSFLALLAFSFIGCADDDPGAGVCSYGGKTYAPGATFPSTDGCNSCFCSADGQVGCTLLACVDAGATDLADARGADGGDAAGPVACTHAGQTHAPGDVFPATDGCNSCHCFEDGKVGCSLKACADAGLPQGDAADAVCQYGGKGYPSGATFPSTDGCNSCFCSDSGAVGCTKKACLPDAGGVCSYGNTSYQPGESFPSTDGCNTCQCLPDGSVACTDKACMATDAGPAPDAPVACAFSTSYEYGYIGGLRVYVDRARLVPERGYSYTRMPTFGDGPTLSCSPPVPDCGPAVRRITPSDVERAIAAPAVQAAFGESSPPLFGRDTRPVDGVVFELRRQDGRGLLVGTACRGAAACRDIPAAVAELRDLLLALDEQQLASAACVDLRR